MRALVRKAISSPELGLVLIIAALAVTLTLLADTHIDRRTGELINSFWNSNTLIQVATDASFFAIMAVGAAIVIISGGIDLSVGSIYALSGVSTAMLLRSLGPMGEGTTVVVGLLAGPTPASHGRPRDAGGRGGLGRPLLRNGSHAKREGAKGREALRFFTRGNQSSCFELGPSRLRVEKLRGR